ncbi:protein-L-isoaspartate O-methyltransferase [Sinorhizobium sojae CCBAU 05684]|uniref:Protein-L-isoaspartate O-methyltransferase n=1 Tax=Sinorhizobium sojae CCBAU 05684 TaxID=716928 RepID=A0A249PFP1_9HYPH|nr:protein-L-isoaspartate O-methyltransferase [Sinorhizobium sojae CCBAU 05684]
MARLALVHSVGSEEQLLTVIDKYSAGQIEARQLIPVRFSRLEGV